MRPWHYVQAYAYVLATHPGFLLALGFMLGVITTFEIMIN